MKKLFIILLAGLIIFCTSILFKPSITKAYSYEFNPIAGVKFLVESNQSPTIIYPSEDATFTISFTNTGDENILSITGVLTLSSAIQFVSCSGFSCSLSNSTLTVTVGDISVGDTSTGSIIIKGLEPGTHLVSGTISGDSAALGPASPWETSGTILIAIVGETPSPTATPTVLPATGADLNTWSQINIGKIIITILFPAAIFLFQI